MTNRRAIKKRLKWLSCLLLTLLLFMFWFDKRERIPSPSCEEKTIFIYDNLDWSIPAFGYYGEASGGMFGNLPVFLQSFGYKVRIDGTISEAKLEDADSLVLINLAEKFDKATKRIIHRYVEAGGSLLLMGDHTGFGFIREPFNTLLGPVPISFQFDSAYPLVPSWQNCMEIRPHPLTERATTENDLQIWTGASLSVGYPANPLIIGKRAFSDAGNIANIQEGYLGDFFWQRSEWLGDVVLAAEGKLGQGKVLVFGDTSPLQNGALPYSYLFVHNIFQWLTQDIGFVPPTAYIFLQYGLWLAFLFSLILLWFYSPFTAVLLIVFSLFLIQLPAKILPRADYPLRYQGVQSVACIDASHGELFDLSGWKKNSIDGLMYNFMRNDYAPFITKSLNAPLVEAADIWVFLNPTQIFSQREKAVLDEFMQKGGLVLWAANYPIQEASLSFLAEKGFTFANLPLGSVKGNYRDYEIQFQDAWPINIANRVKEKTEIFFQKGDFPLVVFQKCGKGGILLISDARFLLNQNLEHIDYFHEGNIRFLRDVLKGNHLVKKE